MDSSTLRHVAIRLAAFREAPLTGQTSTGPVIRFLYTSVYAPFTVIQIRQGQVVVKKANSGEPGFDIDLDTTQVSEADLAFKRVFTRYAKLLRNNDPDTSLLLQAHPELRGGLYRVNDISDRILIPKADSVVYVQQTSPIDGAQLTALLHRIDSIGFWQKPVHKGVAGGIYPTNWHLEVKTGGKHHAIEISNRESGPYYELGKFLLSQYAQLKDDEIQ
ncbi:hypothetical protein [Paraflavitalea pollutisoli]|uniref:hypothetical protein n=1 Tax=Paraflavitalea pollutisoli TaxID=3034143 RepID=UPI0023EC7B9B|nr:hypothetical protein [Paraflavitalea sp. H1-2-19X]